MFHLSNTDFSSSISTDLYTNRSRFLMEVIQNADDNRYPESVVPTICVSIFPLFVKIECNEEGFTEDNIQALCRIGESSKPPGQGYTGEKGIGFKSVFKIAKRAYIRSPPYYFQLDQGRELGMITPQWDEEYFAQHLQEYQTTIILDHICETSTDFSAALRQDVMSIHPMVILFLRRIQRLHLCLFRSVGAESPMSKRFRRHEEDGLFPGMISLENEDSQSKEYFYKLRFASNFSWSEPRRPGVSRTEIVLAFPVILDSGRWKPMPTQLPTFAYLPLGSFGFQVSRL